ncbi:MAG: tRNA (guanosine(46)-N7)-methyltransferase TrmB [Oscillospiraceae bacterium]
MRKKRNLIPRLMRCERVHIKNPEANCGTWLKSIPGFTELHLELGCGKASFTVSTAAVKPTILYIGIEKIADAMVVGMEHACEIGLQNIRFTNRDVLKLPEMFAPQEVSRIYINFCDPWPKKRDEKRRLTSPGFLALYRTVLRDGGEIHFKTDNLPLFEYSLKSFEQSGWVLSEITNDLHGGGVCGVMTDYESKFHEQGIKINRCVAVYGGERV